MIQELEFSNRSQRLHIKMLNPNRKPILRCQTLLELEANMRVQGLNLQVKYSVPIQFSRDKTQQKQKE